MIFSNALALRTVRCCACRVVGAAVQVRTLPRIHVLTLPNVLDDTRPVPAVWVDG
jgi:hypothetical protein